MGYEIWDRFERALVGDFDTEAQALAFLREMVQTLTIDAAAGMLNRFQLVEVTDNGTKTDVKAVGTALISLVARAGGEDATVEAMNDRVRLLRPDDIAARLDVDLRTVEGWIANGELPSIEMAGERFVLVPAFERFVERRDTGVTIEEQAERYIGQGFEVEDDDAFDPLVGLRFPVAGTDDNAETAAEPGPPER